MLLVLIFATISLEAFAARTALTIQTSSETSALLNFQSANDVDGNSVANNGKVYLACKNPGASSATVTIPAQATSKNIAGFGVVTKADVVMSLAAGEEEIAGPFAVSAFNNSSGLMLLNYGGAGAADVDCAPFK